MVTLSVKHNMPTVMRMLDQTRADIVDRAMPRALNRTVEPARTEMARAIAGEFNIATSKAKERLRVNKAKFVRGQFEVSASLEAQSRRGRSMNLINFVEKTVSIARARKAMAAGKAVELRFKIKRGGPYKVIRGAFIANQGRTVFQREGRARLPIKALQTIDVAQMFNTKRLNGRVSNGMVARFPRILAHEIKFYTDRFNRGGRS